MKDKEKEEEERRLILMVCLNWFAKIMYMNILKVQLMLEESVYLNLRESLKKRLYPSVLIINFLHYL